MNKQILFASALAVLGLTSCEKGLDDGGDYMSPTATGQVTNSVLQVRTRSGGAAADEATVAYPVQVYVFQGDECRAAQTIGDAGQRERIYVLTHFCHSVICKHACMTLAAPKVLI
jgi:hypothetical protein